MPRRRDATLALAVAGFLPATGVRADAPTLSTLTAVADTTVFAEQSGGSAYDAVADGQGDSIWTSVIAAGVVRRALVRFDLSSIPPGARVLSAEVGAFMIRLREPQSISLHRLTASWGEGPSNGGGAGIGAAAQPGDCTWSHRFWPTQPWATRGGEYMVSASATASVSGWPAPVLWNSTPQLVDDVQRWVDAPAGNHGWMLIGTESGSLNAARLASRHDGTPSARPQLRLSWLPPVADAEVPLPPWALALLGTAAAAALWRHRR